MITTAGKILLKEHLPAAYRERIDRMELDQKGIAALFDDLARELPAQYPKITADLARLGFEVSTRLGSSVSLADLHSPVDRDAAFARLDKEVAAVHKEHGEPKDLRGQEKRRQAVAGVYQAFVKGLSKELVDAGVRQGHTLAKIVKAGARGSPVQLMQTVFSPVLVQDAHGRPMTDFPIRKSYAEGLSLPEYLAASYGARAGEVAKKQSVPDSGYFSKQLSRALMTVRVEEHDCGTENGVERLVSNREILGTFLARPAGKWKRNNEITSAMLNDLAAAGTDHVVVRSPITCQASRRHHDRAVCQLCAGRRESGLPQVGSFIGISSATSMGEPLAQGQLCLDADTEIRMADQTVKKIRDIRVGDLVLGCSTAGKARPVSVTQVFDQGMQDCSEWEFRVELTSRRLTVTATDSHKILCNVKKWSCKAQTKNQELQVLPLSAVGRDFNAVMASEFVEVPDGVEEPRAMLLGTLIGDGCFTESVNGVFLSCADPEQIAFLNEKYAAAGLRFELHSTKTIYYRLWAIDPEGRKVGAVRRRTAHPVRDWLKDLGLHGKYSWQKTLPPVVWTWNRRSVAELLSGLFVTDGTVYPRKDKGKVLPTISFCSTSEQLVRQIQDLLYWRFGIVTSAVYCVMDGKWLKHRLYRFNLSTTQAVFRFWREIPLFGVKKARLTELMTPMVWKDPAPVLCHRLRRRPVGARHCFDIEVDHPDHLFVLANGMVVSNSLKHSSGSASGPNISSGFALIRQLATIPVVFKDRAAMAEKDGTVTEVRPAPQGGHYVDLGADQHYVPTGFQVQVKKGDQVEAGDVLSEGVVNPADLTRLKGIGEGRKYFADRLKQAFENGGMGGVNIRNFETLARAAIDHVRIVHPEGLGNHLPGQVVSYQAVEREWSPRPDALRARVDQALGLWLEEPVLHYTIGTRITRRIAEHLRSRGITDVLVSRQPPPFVPEMLRIDAVPEHEPDWMHQLYTGHLERKILRAANTGAFSDLKGPSPVAGLAYGVGFGQKG